jgi:DHA1 family tetracycline resistance protein-like MFS transporter
MSSSSRAHDARLWLICAVILIDSLAQSISFPILPRLTRDLLGGDTAAAAIWVGWLEVGWAAPYLIRVPILGALSDRFGRRPLLLVSLVGIGLELLIDALAANVWWLLAGRMLVGVSFAAQVAGLAYVADVTTPAARAGAYGRANAALFLGIVIGPLSGGFLAGHDLRAPFWIGAALALAGAFFAAFVLPESHRPATRAPLTRAEIAPWRALGMLARAPLVPLAFVLLLSWLALQSSDNMLVLYTAHRYGWSTVTFGVFVAIAASVGIVVQGWLTERVAVRFGERRALIGGLGVQALAMAGMGLAASALLFWPAALIAPLGAIARPALQALMSRAVGADEQGRLQGAVAAVASFTSVVSPVAFASLFAWSISGARAPAWAGATILCGAALAAIAALTAAAFAGRHEARTGPGSA